EEVDRWLFSKPGTYRSGAEVLLVERARLHAALNQLEAAEKDLRDFFQVTEQSGPHRTAAAIMLGFLAERKGDAAAARKIWEKALLVPEETTPVYGFEFLYNMIHASLTDKLSDAAAEQFVARVARS